MITSQQALDAYRQIVRTFPETRHFNGRKVFGPQCLELLKQTLGEDATCEHLRAMFPGELGEALCAKVTHPPLPQARKFQDPDE